MKYCIEHKVVTLLENAVGTQKAEFYIDGIRFKQWDFNIRDGWLGDAWIASGTYEAKNFIDAINKFREDLSNIVPKLAFIGQAYIEYVSQPFLIKNLDWSDDKIFFLGFTSDREGVSLMFREEEKEALDFLLKYGSITKEFYYYWNDAVNTIGYSAKLLLMFSAVEALAKKKNGKNDYSKIEKILGLELKEQIYKPRTGIRHRLVHGEYILDSSGRNFVEEIHKKIVNYFNKNIFKKDLISEDVVNPQRHFYDNKEGGKWFIQQIDKNLESDSLIKDVVKDFEENELGELKKFKIIPSDLIDKY